MREWLIMADEPPQPVTILGTTFLVRRIPEAEERAIEVRNLTKIPEAGADRVTLYQHRLAVEDDRLDYALVGWDDPDGTCPCTRESKLQLHRSVRAAILAKANEVRRAAAQAEATGLKNSASLSGTISS